MRESGKSFIEARWAGALVVALAVALLVPAFGQAARPARRDAQLDRLRAAVQARLNEMHAQAEFPGATVGFVLPDGRSASVSVGFADLESRVPLKPTDRLLSGSIGKTYVAAVALQLVQEGRLNLDERIERWFGREAWFERLPNARQITVRHLLNHTSGIPEHVVSKPFTAALKENPDRVWKPEELVAFILDHKPLFPAGQGWSYADTNYILAGMVIERVTGKTFYSEVTRRILKPLKLTRTVPSDSRRIPGLVPGYSRPDSPFQFEGRTIRDGVFVINPQMEWTGGGFASTAEDLARWAKQLYEGKVFRRDLLAQMLDAVEAKTGPGHRYGLGVQVIPNPIGVSYGHSGWFPGYVSDMAYFPEHRIAVAVQFNTDARGKLKQPMRDYLLDAARLVIADLRGGAQGGKAAL